MYCQVVSADLDGPPFGHLQGLLVVNEGHPNHLVDELHEPDLAVSRPHLRTQLLHEVVIDHVQNVEGHHVLELEEVRPRSD